MGKEILVIIPHASKKKPKEIKKQWLSKNQRYLLYSENCETDRGSELLYDFRKLINNQQALFPISQIYINICRSPNKLNEICPQEIRGIKVYNQDISNQFRKKLVSKYAIPFYKKIEKFNGDIILTGHTTIDGHSSLKTSLSHHIILSNVGVMQKREIRKFAPDKLIKIYSEELKKRLPWIRIGFNSVYTEVYDYFSDRFGWQEKGNGIPLIHQETDESLYIRSNKINVKQLNKLKRVFAESLVETAKRFRLG